MPIPEITRPLDSPSLTSVSCSRMAGPNLVKPFSIAGFVAGEIYLLFAALAPYHNGQEVQMAGKIWRILAASLFFGPFGAVVGMGVGLLATGIFRKRP